MSTRPRRIARKSTVVALGVALSIALLQGFGTASVPKPGDRVTGTITDTSPLPSGDTQTDPATSGQTSTNQQAATSGTTDPSADTTTDATKSTDDSPGHETPLPGPPDHASGSIAEVALAGQDLVELGSTNAQVNDDGTSQGDVTVLAIGGQEIVGAHSDSEGEQSASFDPFAPLCSGSGGAICLGLLFADTNSTNEPEASHSDASTSLALACVGGSGDNIGAACQSAPVTAGVSTSSSSIDRDKTTGAETATQQTDLANACVGGRTETGTCSAVGIDAVHSESTSSVDGNKQAQTESSSYLADVQIAGQDFVVISDPTAITIPPGCPTGASLLCIFFNQGAMSVSTGQAGSRQEAVHISVLPGVAGGSDVALAHLGIAESFVRWSPPHITIIDRCEAFGICPHPPRLAFTGFGMGMPLAVLVFLILSSTTLITLERRRLAIA
jgi:hypothetical protein